MKTKITIPKIFKPLFLPNYTEEERKRFTPKYKADINTKFLYLKGKDRFTTILPFNSYFQPVIGQITAIIYVDRKTINTAMSAGETPEIRLA